MAIIYLLAIPAGLALLGYGILTGDGHGVAFGIILPLVGGAGLAEEFMVGPFNPNKERRR